MPTQAPPFLTVNEAHEALLAAGWDIGRSRLYEMVRHGELPATRLGSRIRIHRNDLLPYLGEQRVAQPA